MKAKYRLQARFRQTHINRGFTTLEAAQKQAQQLVKQHPEWSARDFLTITEQKATRP
jgi:hypothetical protein